jgi:hypothetical protein
VASKINKGWERQTVNYLSYRKWQINCNVLSDQTLYLQNPQGLIETVIGLDLQDIDDEFKRQMYNQPTLKDMEFLTAIPSLVMALLSCRFGIFWLMNVILLICVPVSVSRLSKGKGKVTV